MRIAWHGHSFFHLTTRAGTSVLVDPFVENGKTAKRATDFAPRFILLTHGHDDHTGSVLHYKDAHVVGNGEILSWLAAKGIADRTHMNIGGSVQLAPDLRVHMTSATHSSGLDDATREDGIVPYGGTPAGYLVDDGETKVYLAGDTGLFGDMKWVIRDVLKPDVAILPIGDRFTMGVEHAAIAAEWVGAKVVLPCHYGTFPPIDTDPHAFAKLVPNADVRVLAVDSAIEVRGPRVVRAPGP